eukprot:NODE_57_length_25931_cov_0.351037.p7 type:complete len:483 gc:universal NODE_57_length_25931_cov_0.351037:7158-8606(+)
MSRLGCIFPEIDLISSEFELSKVAGKFSGHKGSRDIHEANQIPVNRRFSTDLSKSVEKVGMKDGLMDVNDVLPAFMSIKTDFQPSPFTGKYENVRTKIFQRTNSKINGLLKTQKITFTNVVDIDDSEFGAYIKRNLACKFGESGFFKGFMLFVVLMNTFTLALQTDTKYQNNYALDVIDCIFQGIFVFEVCFKWFYGFKVYWKSAWNWLDFSLAALPLLGSSLNFLNAGKVFKVVRVFKVLRSLRSIQSFDSLLRITQSIGKSIPQIVNTLLLLGILMVVFAIVGVDILNTDDFDSFDVAMFSLFQVTTQDGWVNLIQACKDKGQRVEAYLYFGLFEIIGVFILQNLIIAAIVNNTQDTFEQVKARKTQQNRKLLSMYTQKDPKFYDQSVVHLKPNYSEYTRVPYQVIQKDKLDSGKVDKLCLFIGIMEHLYSEIERKSKELSEIQDMIKFNEMKISSTEAIYSENDLDELDVLSSLLKGRQ